MKFLRFICHCLHLCYLGIFGKLGLTHGQFEGVLQVLKEKKLFTKYIKCEFWLRSVAFFGHIISSEGVEVDSRKTEVVKN